MSVEERWAVEFLQAKKESSCPLYTRLANDLDFPLYELAFVRVIEHCPLTDEELSEIWSNKTDSLSPWIKESFYQTSLSLAQKRGLNKYSAHFMAKLIPYQKLPEEKIDLAQRAIKIAPKEEKDIYTEELYKVAPRFYPKPTQENIYFIAHDFEKNREYRKARQLYLKIIAQDEFSLEDKIKAWDRVRLTFKLEHNHDAYLVQTRRLNEFIRQQLHHDYQNPKLQETWLEYQITLARVLWTRHQAQSAKKILENLLAFEFNYPNKLALIYKNLAGIAMEEKQLDTAIAYLAECLILAITDSELRDEINWLRAWLYYRQNDYPQAFAALKQAEDDTENFFFKLKLQFWQAKNLQLMGEIKKANKLLAQLVENDNFGYYGIIAHKELQRPFSPIKQDTNYVLPRLSVLEWALSMDEPEVAQTYLRVYASRLQKPEEIEEVLPLFARTNDYSYALSRFYSIGPEFRDDILNRKANIIFPRPYLDLVEKSAKRFDLSQEYIYSIMRQESAFNPKAKSPAEAYGLMQLIPVRAQELAKRYRIKYKTPNDMYQEKINIFMGSALLHLQKKKFNNQFIPTTASYNAHENAVSHWLEHRFDGDHIAFLEEIPYSETQSYVKLVLRNLINYRRQSCSEKFLFPQDIFTSF